MSEKVNSKKESTALSLIMIMMVFTSSAYATGASADMTGLFIAVSLAIILCASALMVVPINILALYEPKRRKLAFIISAAYVIGAAFAIAKPTGTPLAILFLPWFLWTKFPSGHFIISADFLFIWLTLIFSLVVWGALWKSKMCKKEITDRTKKKLSQSFPIIFVCLFLTLPGTFNFTKWVPFDNPPLENAVRYTKLKGLNLKLDNGSEILLSSYIDIPDKGFLYLEQQNTNKGLVNANHVNRILVSFPYKKYPPRNKSLFSIPIIEKKYIIHGKDSGTYAKIIPKTKQENKK